MRTLTGMVSVFRGAASRGATSVMILVVATVAVAAATAGPVYYSASQTSILRDAMASTPVLGRGFEVLQTGSVSGRISALSTTVQSAIDRAPGSNRYAFRVFQPPIEGIEGTTVEPVFRSSLALVWRSGFCRHLEIAGACPSRPGDIVVSRTDASTNHWRSGQRVTVATYGTLAITGIYAPPGPSDDYWLDRLDAYFPFEYPPFPVHRPTLPQYNEDAMFTVQATLEKAPASAQGTLDYAQLLSPSRLHTGDVGRLATGVDALVNDPQLQAEQAIVTSTVPQVVDGVRSSWSALAVPTLLISTELLVLAWLLLFLLVTEAVDSRGGDIALAKLRGHGPVRTVIFAVSEPVAILAIALPLGVLAGWASATLLGQNLLRSGTPVGLPAAGWAAAVAATIGGLAAVAIASVRTVRRPVAEQWRRANKKAPRRTWVFDAILLTCATAGLIELFLAGPMSSARRSGLSLLVPGLIGLAVAVVAARALPAMCRAAMHRTGSIAGYLAVRHVARRPEGSRTMIMLATSFALATFAIASWSVGRGNYETVARAESGAPTVLTVNLPFGQDLDKVVADADPTGDQAAGVELYGSNGAATLAVDPARFARVASWGPGAPAHTPQALSAALEPPAPPPLVLTGDAVRVRVASFALSPAAAILQMDVEGAARTGPTPVELGRLPRSGTVDLVAPMVGCPCLVRDLTLLPQGGSVAAGTGPANGSLTLQDLAVHSAGGWSRVADSFNDGRRWRSESAVVAGEAGLTWKFSVSRQAPVLESVNRPAVLPAIVASGLTHGRRGIYSAVGLDGNPISVAVVATADAVPGAPSNGVIVDRRYAESAADYNMSSTVEQVWVRNGGDKAVEYRLRIEGVQITGTQEQATIRSTLARQGPGLASVLFIAEAGAAAVLAAGGAILGIFLSSRRRRYEFAALEATGMRRRTLLAALVAEQSIVLGFGAIVGVVAGVAALAAVLRDVPEFLATPSSPALSYVPPEGEMLLALGVFVGLAAATVVVASISLVRSIRLEQLREAPT